MCRGFLKKSYKPDWVSAGIERRSELTDLMAIMGRWIWQVITVISALGKQKS